MANDVRFAGRHYNIVYSDIVRELKDAKVLGLYCILLTYAGNKQMAHPSLATLAADMGLSKRSINHVKACLRKLIDCGLVETVGRWRNDDNEIAYEPSEEFNQRCSNGYIVHDRIRECASDHADTGELPPSEYGQTPVRIETVPPSEYGRCPHPYRDGEEIHIEGLHKEANTLPTLSAVKADFDHSAVDDAQARLGRGARAAETRTGKPSKRQLDDEFENFWKLVGRKRGKQQARKSFEQQRRTHSMEFICSQIMKAQAEWMRTGREPEYWPHPSTWLNQQLDDDYDTTSVPSQREFYEARVQMIREQHVREKAQLNAIADDVSMPAITSTCVEDDDEDDDDDDWDWGA